MHREYLLETEYLCSPPQKKKFYADALTTSVTAFGDRAFMEGVRVIGSDQGGALI